LVRTPEGKRLFRRRSNKYVYNITRMDLMKAEWEGVDWMHVAQDMYQW